MPNVLILEDDALSAMLLEKLLVESGHQVFCTSTSDEATRVIQNSDINIFLSDWAVDGAYAVDEVARQLRARNPHSRLVFMSGYDKEVICAALEGLAPFDIYVKPIDFEFIVESL